MAGPPFAPRIPAMSQSDGLLQWWYAALRSPCGIALRTNRPDALVRKLYAARSAAFDTSLDAISIVRSPTDAAVLWLLKRSP